MATNVIVKLLTAYAVLSFCGDLTNGSKLDGLVASLNCDQPSSKLTTTEQYRHIFNCSRVKEIAGEITQYVQRTFDFLDTNHNGMFENDEAEDALEFLNIPENENRRKFELCDADESGDLNIEEYAECSVISYGEIFTQADKNEDRMLSRQEMDNLIRGFAKVVYTTMTFKQQQNEINKLGKGATGSYSLVDVVIVDTRLFELYLDERENL